MNEAYVNGCEAFAAGKDESENPYPNDSRESVAWGEGWRDAREEYDAGI